MRAASILDFRTTIKFGQQAPELSGYPMLTPLSAHSSQSVDECFSYSSSPEQNLTSLTQAMELNHFPNPGGRSPQTPEPIVYHEPISIIDNTDHYSICQPWSDEALTSSQLGFDLSMSELLPRNIWSASETAQTMPVSQMSWLHHEFLDSPQQIPMEFTPRYGAVPSINTSEYSVDDYSADAMPGDWKIYRPTATQMYLANMVTSGPFMHHTNSFPMHAPLWEDTFIPGSSSY
jgi:hypothetical protein